MAPLKGVRKRFQKWSWKMLLRCCCTVEKLDSWESMDPEDWEDKLMSPWASSQHGQEYGHLVSLDLMRSWGSRGDFLRALRDEDFLGPGSMLNPHPVLSVCLGFRNCELTTGKDYSCYCRVRTILRGPKSSYTDTDVAKLDCEPIMDGISAHCWVKCINPMLSNLYQLSSLRHKRSNVCVKKFITSDAITSDPIHMMYVHIEGMIPQFGPFLFEVWRRNQGLQMGAAGEALQHGLGVVITHPKRQALEIELRQIFPNKSLKMKVATRERSRRRKSSILGRSSSCVFASTVRGTLADALKKTSKSTPVIDTGSAVNINQSAEVSHKATDSVFERNANEIEGTSPKVDQIMLPVVICPNPSKTMRN